MCQTEEEREKYLLDLECRNQEPITRQQFEEIKQIMDEIDKNDIPLQLRNARKIREWMDKQENTTIPPRARAEDPEEKKLGNAIKSIRTELLRRI